MAILIEIKDGLGATQKIIKIVDAFYPGGTLNVTTKTMLQLRDAIDKVVKPVCEDCGDTGRRTIVDEPNMEVAEINCYCQATPTKEEPCPKCGGRGEYVWLRPNGNPTTAQCDCQKEEE